MTERNIVERLRDWRGDPDEVMSEAADLIEQLRAEVSRVEGQRNASNRHIEKLTDALAESQAREAALREALRHHYEQDISFHDRQLGAAAAIAIPPDDTALRERIAQEVEAEREACAKACESLLIGKLGNWCDYDLATLKCIQAIRSRFEK